MLRFLYFCFKLFIILGLIGLAVTLYLFYHYSRGLPDYSQLANYHPPSVTRVYSSDGKLMEEYALERRVFIPISAVPRSLIEAFLSAEDKNFYIHHGIDIISIVRAAILNVSNILHRRRMEGGSTITQQVVKNFLLTSEVSIERKIKEAILSYMLSRTFTKDQILELYLNQTFFGKGAYGVAMAAQNYFNKSVEDLNIAEAAFIAALPKAPSNFNPEKNYDRVKARRDYVIHRMLEDGYITYEAAKEAIDLPIILQKRDRNETVTAGYYAEQVREEVMRIIESHEEFYTAGLTVITSLDAKIQKFAQNSLRKGIREYDRKNGFRGAITNISDITNWHEKLKKIPKPPALLEYHLTVVLKVADNYVEIGLQDGTTSKIAIAEMKWAKTNLKSAKELLKIGDVIIAEPIKLNYALRQIPAVNGGIMIMNPSTGQVLASVGGYDFSASKFDRATQALRQPGSLSKTFVYLAALENGIQPNSIFEDGPIEISQGAGMPVWKPKNYKGDFLGNITMRTGLEKSRNLITVRVAQTIGLNKIVEIIKRFGINSQPQKVYSMVLGAIETTLQKMTTAYAIIANSGKKVTPYFVEMIKDRNGKIIYRRDNRQCDSCRVSDLELAGDALPPQIPNGNEQMITDDASNYQITSFLEGAVERGTAASAKKLGKIIAGKSGTTNESMDTWFVGFTPKIVVGTYIGYDAPKSLGKNATGSSVALPIFIDFMENAYKNEPSLAFKVPESIKFLTVDQKSGRLMPEGKGIMEAFKANELPVLNSDESDIFHQLPQEKDLSSEVY